MRRKLSERLRCLNSYYNLPKEARVNLAEIDKCISSISRTYKNPGKKIEEYCSDELLLLNLFLTALGALALAARNSEEDQNKILDSEFSGQDIHLCGLVNNIANTALSSINLIKQGFDTQARVLLRTIDERIYQCLILLSSSEDFEIWSKAEDQEEAKVAHYKLFARKGRMLKKVAELESKYLAYLDQGSQMKTWRKERESFYSMAVHGSSAAVFVGSTAFSFEEDGGVIPNLFGIPSSASELSLYHLVYQMRVFSIMLDSILKEIHRWRPNLNDELHRKYLAANDSAVFLSEQWLDNQSA